MTTSRIEFRLNGRDVQVEVDESTPLLWVVRDHLGQSGAKYSCGIGICGACTLHVDGKAVTSCVLPVSAIRGKEITTIEGLAARGGQPVLDAWIAEEVPQCGYCQPGMIMNAAALLSENDNPSDLEIDRRMTNLCRCGTYARVRRAIHRVAREKGAGAVSVSDEREGERR